MSSRPLAALAVLLFLVPSVAQAPPALLTAVPPPAAPPPAHYQAVRQALVAKVGDGVVLLRGADKAADMGAFVQLQDILYLSGVAEPGVAMLLGGGGLDELLVPPHSRFASTWEGEFLAPGEAAAAQTGFAKVGNVRQLQARLDELLAERDGKRPVLWTPLQPEPYTGGTPGSAAGAAGGIAQDPWDGRASRPETLRRHLQERYQGLEVRDLTPVLHALRGTKLPAEIELLRRCAAVAAAGHLEAMRCARVGLHEYHLAAVARAVFSLHGAGPDAYGAIVGAGKNGCVLHYMQNTAPLRDGDLVVMDYAPTLRGYATDVTRTFPANGRFTPAQRRLVEDVHAIQQELLAMVKPGASLGAIGQRCSELLQQKGYRSDHGPCHHVGLAVHDPGPDVLAPGMVITVEPGAYLRDQGMGCRIEDTVLVTAEGHEVLSAAVPSSPDAIEQVMAEAGVLAPAAAPRR